MKLYKKLKQKYNRFFRSIRFIYSHPIGRREPVRSFYRYISFHFIHLFSRDRRIYHFLDQIYYFCKPGDGIQTSYYVGLEDFEVMGFLLHLLRSDDLFVDVGANVGSYSLLASGVKKARIIAFEPAQETYDILTRNIHLNHLENLILPFQKGLGSQQKHLEFTRGLGVLNRIIEKQPTSHDSAQVDIVTLDSIIDSTPILIKIDVEGYELEVLKGAQQTLSDYKLKALIVEINGSGEYYGVSNEDVHNFLIEKGFTACNYDPFTHSITTIVTYNKNNPNTIYIRDIETVGQRCLESQRYKIRSVEI